MSFKQVDGNKNILINENGNIRRGLVNIEPEYEHDKQGNIKKDVWPVITVQSDNEAGVDKRLLPAEVLKLHGKLARNGRYAADMFEANDDDKTNCSADNITFNEDAAPGNPYKGKDDSDEGSGSVVSDPAKEGEAEVEDEVKADAEGKESNASGNKIAGKSTDFTANEAIEIINNNTLADLQASNFYDEENRDKGVRVTVEEAWNDKLEEAE